MAQPPRVLAVVLLAWFAALPAQAAIVVSGTPSTDSGTGTLQITTDISFTITTDNSAVRLVFHGWNASSDAGGDTISFAAPTSFDYQINGGSLQSGDFFGILDNRTADLNDLGAADTAINLSSTPVTTGDILTIKAGSWSFPGSSAFNPGVFGSFTGNASLMRSNGHRISEFTPVPEPRDYALMAGAGLVAWAAWRRRIKAA